MPLDLDAIRSRVAGRPANTPVGGVVVRLLGVTHSLEGRLDGGISPELENIYAITIEGIPLESIDLSGGKPAPREEGKAIFRVGDSERAFFGYVRSVTTVGGDPVYAIRVHTTPEDWYGLKVIDPSANQDIADLISEVEKLRRGR